METATPVSETVKMATLPLCLEPPGGLGVRLHFETLLPLLSLPLTFPLFHFYLFFSSPLSLPSLFFPFGLDRLSRFVVLTVTVVFPSTRDICFHVLSLCICQFSLTFLPVRLYCLRSPYAPRHSSHLVKNNPQSFACTFSREGVWLAGCGLVPTGQISAQQ